MDDMTKNKMNEKERNIKFFNILKEKGLKLKVFFDGYESFAVELSFENKDCIEKIKIEDLYSLEMNETSNYIDGEIV